MATKATRPGNVDELFKWTVRAMFIFAIGVILLGIGAFAGVSAINWFGYLLIGIAFATLLWMSQPIWD